MISVLFVVLVGFVASFFIFPLEKKETDNEKLSRLLDHTGQAIYEQNKMLVEGYNKAVDDSQQAQLSSVSVQSSQYVGAKGSLAKAQQSTADIEIENVKSGVIRNLTELYIYYSIAEYFEDCLEGSDDFLNKVFFLDVHDFDNIYSKLKVTETGMSIYVLQYEDETGAKPYSGDGWRRYIKISIEYDWKYDKPLSIKEYAIESGEDGADEKYYYSEINFENKTFSLTKLAFIDGVAYENYILKNEDFLKKNIDAISIYSLKYDDVSSIKGYSFYNVKESDFNNVLTTEQSKYIIDAYKNMDFLYWSEFTQEIDISTAVSYENAIEAISYVVDKYSIKYDESGIYLTIRKNKGLDEDVETALFFLNNEYNKSQQFSSDVKFDELNYTYQFNPNTDDPEYEKYDGDDFRKNITQDTWKDVIPEKIYNLVKNWYINQYDADKYYFGYNNVGDYYLKVNEDDFHLIKVDGKNIEYYEMDFWYSETGVSWYNFIKVIVDSDKYYASALRCSVDPEANVLYEVYFDYHENSIGYDEYISDYYKANNNSSIFLGNLQGERIHYSKSKHNNNDDDYTYDYFNFKNMVGAHVYGNESTKVHLHSTINYGGYSYFSFGNLNNALSYLESKGASF